MLQLCKLINYKLTIIKINILPFLCVETPLPFVLHTLIKKPSLKPVTPLNKDNDKKVVNT